MNNGHEQKKKAVKRKMIRVRRIMLGAIIVRALSAMAEAVRSVAKDEEKWSEMSERIRKGILGKSQPRKKQEEAAKK